MQAANACGAQDYVRAAIKTVAPAVLGAAPGTTMQAANACGAQDYVRAAIRAVAPAVLGAVPGSTMQAANACGAQDHLRAALKTVAPAVLGNFNADQLRVFFGSDDQSKSSSALLYLSALSAKHGSNVRTSADQR
jgi:hypothetical protein